MLLTILWLLLRKLKIEKCNARIKFSKLQRETTYQVTLDALKLSPCYLAFLITAEVPEVYMHQFWNTIKKIKETDAYRFKLDKKKFRIDTEVFHEILQICHRIPNQDFVEPPSEEEMVPFIKELGYTGKCDMLFEIHTNHMHQPWRTFATVINRCIYGKSIGLDRLRPSRAQILWGMFNEKNVNYVPLCGKILCFKRTTEKQVPYVKRTCPTQDSLKDTPGVFVSKKKAQVKVDRGKGMDLLSNVALLEAAQLKKVLKKSKQDTHMLHASGSDDGVGSQPKVPDELEENTTSINEGTDTIPGVLDVPKDQSKSKNESWRDSGDNYDNDDDSNDDNNDNDSDDDGNNEQSDDDHEQADDERTESDDEYVHTPDYYVPTDEETNDESKEFDEEE
ncbi:hypothetical protein Tco_0952647 [Tanacetum coccineum]|uniref:Uncharacterized protein n=1 Tax=Tanacetum coccineum TaxID=301880 RepID=A0ABQ5DXL7_9ASTR